MAVRKYIYDGNAVLQETDGTGVTVAEYTRTGGGYGDLLSAYDGTSAKYYEPDALGSTDALADQSQAVADRWSYRAFGPAAQTAGTDSSPFTWVGRLGYFADAETGLYLLGSSYYDQATIAFLTKNAIGRIGGSPNLYQYSGNSPINLVAPSGRLPVPIGEGHGGSDQRYSAQLARTMLSRIRNRSADSGVNRISTVSLMWPSGTSKPCACAQTENPKGPIGAGKPTYSPRTDEECCRDAMYDRLDHGDWGGVVCCDGRKVACDWSPYARNPVLIPEGAWHICILQHEKVHFDHIEACPATAPSLTRPPFWRQWNQAQLECDAYKAQLECLADFISICEFLATEAKRAKCRKEFLQHNNLIRRSANKNYNCGFVLFPPGVLDD